MINYVILNKLVYLPPNEYQDKDYFYLKNTYYTEFSVAFTCDKLLLK